MRAADLLSWVCLDTLQAFELDASEDQEPTPGSMQLCKEAKKQMQKLRQCFKQLSVYARRRISAFNHRNLPGRPARKELKTQHPSSSS